MVRHSGPEFATPKGSVAHEDISVSISIAANHPINALFQLLVPNFATIGFCDVVSKVIAVGIACQRQAMTAHDREVVAVPDYHEKTVGYVVESEGRYISVGVGN